MFGRGVGRRMVLARIRGMLGRKLEEADVGGVVHDSNVVVCTDI